MAKTESTTRAARATAIVAGITAAAAIVAIAARAPLSRSSPIDAASARRRSRRCSSCCSAPASSRSAMVMILAFRQRRRKDDPDERLSEPPEIHWIWKVLATLAPLAVGAALIVAAVTGSKKVNGAAGLSGGFGGGFGGALEQAAPATGAHNGFVLPAWLPWTILAILLVAVAAGVVALALRRDRDAALPTDPSRARPAMPYRPRSGARRRYRSTRSGDRRVRRDAAHACRTRLRRSPSEAPREFLRRVLVASRATERDATTLTGLFEEARFSTHPISERTRELALAALRSLERRPQVSGAG